MGVPAQVQGKVRQKYTARVALPAQMDKTKNIDCYFQVAKQHNKPPEQD
jgi:hypothetical protein